MKFLEKKHHLIKGTIAHLHASTDESYSDYIYDLAQLLTDKGYPSSILCVFNKGNQYKKEGRNIPIVHYGGSYIGLLLDLFRCLALHPIKTHKIVSRWLSKRLNLTMLHACLCLILHNVVILHVQRAYQGPKAMILSELCGIPWILHLRGNDVKVTPLVDPNWKNCLKKLLHQCSAVVAVCRNLIQEASCYADIQNKSHVIYVTRPSSEKIVLAQQMAGNKKNEILIVATGRLVWEKGFSYALDALPFLLDQGFKKWKFVLMGDGLDREALIYQAKELHLLDYIELQGKVKKEDVVAFLPHADIYLQPSITEGIPASLFEAMAARLPCIVTNAGGMTEIVSNGYNGIVIPSRSAKAIAQALLTLISDEKLRFTLGENASKTVATYTPDYEAEETIKIYQQILSKK